MLRNVICLKWESSSDMMIGGSPIIMGMFNGPNGNEEQSPVGVLIQRCKMVHPGGNHVGHPGCHEQLPVTTMTGPTGDGWESTHRTGDDLGMIYSWFYHSNMSQMSFQYYQPTMDEANVS